MAQSKTVQSKTVIYNIITILRAFGQLSALIDKLTMKISDVMILKSHAKIQTIYNCPVNQLILNDYQK